VADKSVSQGISHLPFKLSSAGEGLYLTAPDNKLVDSHEWSAAVADQSFARFADGIGAFTLARLPAPLVRTARLVDSEHACPARKGSATFLGGRT